MLKAFVKSRSKSAKIRRRFSNLDVSRGSMMRKIRNKEIEENRRDDRTLRYTRVDDPQGRMTGVEETRSGSALKICCKSPDDIQLKLHIPNLLNEQKPSRYQ
jgi:hypothetical protein